jgi:hypothetical protein
MNHLVISGYEALSPLIHSPRAPQNERVLPPTSQRDSCRNQTLLLYIDPSRHKDRSAPTLRITTQAHVGAFRLIHECTHRADMYPSVLAYIQRKLLDHSVCPLFKASDAPKYHSCHVGPSCSVLRPKPRNRPPLVLW